MALVSAPLLSLDASGSVGGALVFSKWKGRPYVRQLVKPANPRSGGQVGMRSMMKFLSQNWTSVSSADKASWQTQADAIVASPFNAYVKANLTGWRNFLAPAEAYPMARAYTADDITGEAAVAGVRQITVSGTASNVETHNWGVCIFRSLTSSLTTAWSNCIAIVICLSGNTFAYVDSPLVPDTYYYNFRGFTDDGVLGPEETEVNAVVS